MTTDHMTTDLTIQDFDDGYNDFVSIYESKMRNWARHDENGSRPVFAYIVAGYLLDEMISINEAIYCWNRFRIEVIYEID